MIRVGRGDTLTFKGWNGFSRSDLSDEVRLPHVLDGIEFQSGTFLGIGGVVSVRLSDSFLRRFLSKKRPDGLAVADPGPAIPERGSESGLGHFSGAGGRCSESDILEVFLNNLFSPWFEKKVWT